MRFEIITLDAKKMLDLLDSKAVFQKADKNYGVRLRYDLSERSSERAIILRTYAQQTNALFWQLSAVLSQTDCDKLVQEEPSTLLKHALIYIDFKQIFSDSSSFTLPTKTLSKEELGTDSKPARYCKLDAMFEDGIELSFDGKNFKRFIAFDKSSSMSRQCAISFVDADLKADLDERLAGMLDLAGRQVVLSKYYAYRGLYLTSATRIDPARLNLNAETVIVLDDFFGEISETEIFTAVKENDEWQARREKKSLRVNLFDGEGLISPDYADAINNCLSLEQAATSFQIRMPYTKGVLHKVDFLNFLRTELGFSTEKPVLIKDFFGVNRDLCKAKIILTKSMFKCAGWLKETADKHVMEKFFEHCNEFEHALYVALTDSNLHNTGWVQLNYQFLSTLRFAPKDFDSLVDDHIRRLRDIPQTLRKIFSAEDSIDDTDDLADTELDGGIVNFSRDEMFRVLAQNDAFLKEPKIKAAIKDCERDAEFDLALGKFKVRGENRFFSGDLLQFLLMTAARIIGGRKKMSTLKEQTLRPQNFYMPESKPTLKNQPYVFLRSPHLSQNEQCLLSPLLKNNLYDKYFSHLTGVVMVSTRSTVALALGGADFDGDIVKVISDARIVDAVKNLHTLSDDGTFTRNLPVIEIPSGNSTKATIPRNITFDLVRKTFDNQVGQISNIAIKMMSLADSAPTVEQKTAYLQEAAMCTIITGLDIDAAKTGIRPTKNIATLRERVGKKISPFLEAKKIIEQLKSRRFAPLIEDDGKTIKLFTSTKEKDTGTAALSIDKQEIEHVAFIDLLPQLYLKYLKEKPKSTESIAPINENYFAFQSADWKERLDNRTFEVKQLAQIFNTFRRLIREIESARQFWSEQNHDSRINVILDIQYDGGADGVKESKLQVYTTLKDYFNLSNIDAALYSVRAEKWHFTAQDLREDKLETLCNDNELLPDAVALLTNFREQGYLLLYYALADLKAELKSDNTDAATDIEHIERSDKWDELTKAIAVAKAANNNPYWDKLFELCNTARKRKYSAKKFDEELDALNQSFTLPDGADSVMKIIERLKRDRRKGLREGIGLAKENPHWQTFYDKYITARAEKWTIALFDKELIKLCRAVLAELFNGDFNEALKYFWANQSADQSHNFFWNVFTEQEILNNLPKSSAKGGDSHA